MHCVNVLSARRQIAILKQPGNTQEALGKHSGGTQSTQGPLNTQKSDSTLSQNAEVHFRIMNKALYVRARTTKSFHGHEAVVQYKLICS
jgi:hypothetical protein